MPYTIDKKKCKQSDGDSGTHVLSYTDGKGKDHDNCHTSKKGAQGQIAAIEGDNLAETDDMVFGGGGDPEAEGEADEDGGMDEALIREYIREKLIFEARSDPNSALNRMRKHFGIDDFGATVGDGASSGTNKVGKGAQRIKGEALDDDAALKAKFPAEWKPEVLGSGYHSTNLKTVKLTIPHIKPDETQVRYVVWDDGGSKGPAALKNQVLGYVCEHALAAAINGQEWDPNLMDGDARVSKYFALPPGDPVRKTVDHFAKGAVAVAVKALAKAEIEPPLKGATVGTGGDDVVDVQTETADCHVKYNDNVRLIGLQRLGGKSKRNMGDDILDAIASEDPKAYTTLLDEIEEELPATTTWKMAREEFALQVFGRSLKAVEEEKDPAQEELMLYRKYRKDFLKFLDGEEVAPLTTPLKGAPKRVKGFKSKHGSIRAKLEERLRAFMLTGKEAEPSIYFFNFEGEVSPPSEKEGAPELGAVSVGLTIKKIGMTADQVRVTARDGKDDSASTHLYKIELNSKDAAGTEAWTEIGQIEMRTRGTQMHPPQVKTKRGQNFADDVASIEAAPPAVTTENKYNKTNKKILVTRRTLESLISESLLKEDLSRADRTEISRIFKKEMEKSKIAKKIIKQEIEAQKKATQTMVDKSFKKNFDKELRAALGASFFGTPGKINKFVIDEIQAEVQKMLGDKATKEIVVQICKDVIIKLYRELSFSYPQVIQRIKV